MFHLIVTGMLPQKPKLAKMTPKGAIDGLGKLLCIHNIPMLRDHGRSNQLARYIIFDMCMAVSSGNFSVVSPLAKWHIYCIKSPSAVLCPVVRKLIPRSLDS